MSQTDYYELLGIQPSASLAEVKQAYRQLISRYHPDKVQHLGKEFQNIAAGRTAELTAAYHVLSHEGRRSEYDRTRQAVTAPVSEPPPAAESDGAKSTGPAFSRERASCDEFVRKATLSRFRQELDVTTQGGYEVSQARGFDLACVPKSKLFGRTKGPRLACWFVSRVDGDAVADAWMQAGKWNARATEGVCVFLIGPMLAPRRELEDAVSQQRRRPVRGGPITVIPINARNWDAYMPLGAPPVAKALLDRLRG